MASLSDRLISLQREKKVLKKDIANAAGVSIMGYYRYERGTRLPTSDTLIKIADFYNVSVDYLVGRSDNPARLQ